MVLVHFVENRTVVLSQLVKNIPAVDENLKIKGRKGKVISVKEIENNVVHVEVAFEKLVKNNPILKDTKKKKK